MARTLDELEADFDALAAQVGDVTPGSVTAVAVTQTYQAKKSTQAVERVNVQLARIRGANLRRV